MLVYVCVCMACMHPAGGQCSKESDGEDRKGEKRDREIAAAAGAADKEGGMDVNREAERRRTSITQHSTHTESNCLRAQSV